MHSTIHPTDGAKSFRGQQIIASDGHGGAVTIVSAGAGYNSDWVWKGQADCELHQGTVNPGMQDACDDPKLNGECANRGQPGALLWDIFLSRTGPAGPFVLVESICLDPGMTPVSIDDVTAQIQRYVDQLVPPAPSVTMQPANQQTLVELPTLFQAGSAARVNDTFFPSGIAVDVTATPTTWDWTVDGRAAFTTQNPGRQYDGTDPRADPAHYASYTFTRPGEHAVRCTVEWTATAEIPGIGPVDINGVVRRASAPLHLGALEARAQLESGYQ